jgi:sterol desaturase/sphingolipid hydroxylase (fatty acid hydroxylase superfamily)
MKLISSPFSNGIRSIIGLSFALACGAAVVLSADFFANLSAQQVPIVKAALAAQTTASIFSGIWAFVFWWIIVIGFSLIIFVPFFILELVYDGPPESWRIVFFSLTLKIVSLGSVLVIGYLLSYVDPRKVVEFPLIYIQQVKLEPFLGSFAGVVLALSSLLIYDAVLTAVHVAQHKVPFLWRFHAVHHSTEKMDSLNSNAHPFDFVGHWVGLTVLAVALGFKNESIFLLAAFMRIHERLLHTRAPINFGFLRGILIDNRFHFVHHSINPKDFDKNFGSYFTLWDRLLGTYSPPPEHLVKTGVSGLHSPRSLAEFVFAKLKPNS